MPVSLNHREIAAYLKSAEVRAALHTEAQRIATVARQHASILRHGAEVKVEDFTTDRAVVQVAIDHPAGVGIEGKYGVLAKAART